MNSISVSELKTFTTCSRQHHYRYTKNLTKRQIEIAPDTGVIGHAYLESLSKGIDTTIEVRNFVDNMIREKQPLTQEEYDQIIYCRDTILEVTPKYLKKYREEQFTPVIAETKFEVKIPGLDVSLIGYIDAIVKDQSGNHWLMEHKFPQRSFRQEDDLILDTQIVVYQWVAQQLGYPIVGTIYNQILAKKFTIPSLVDKGKRLSKVAIYCDWETYCRYIVAWGLDINDHLDMQEKLQPEIARRYYIYRSPEEVQNYADELFEKVSVMKFLQDKGQHWMNESVTNCNNCMFRNLCVNNLKGVDIEGIIRAEYQIKGSRTRPVTNFESVIDEEPEVIF